MPAASLWVTSRVRTAVERVNFSDDFGFEKCVSQGILHDFTLETHPRPHISCCLIATCNQFPF